MITKNYSLLIWTVWMTHYSSQTSLYKYLRYVCFFVSNLNQNFWNCKYPVLCILVYKRYDSLEPYRTYSLIQPLILLLCSYYFVLYFRYWNYLKKKHHFQNMTTGSRVARLWTHSLMRL